MRASLTNAGLPQVSEVIDRDIVCPAGRVANCGNGVRCLIEHHTLMGQGEGRAIAAYCLGQYTACSTWQADWEDRALRRQLAAEAKVAGE